MLPVSAAFECTTSSPNCQATLSFIVLTISAASIYNSFSFKPISRFFCHMQVQNSEALQPISEPEPEATNAPHVADVRHTQNPRKKRQRTSQQHGNGQQNMKASHTGLCQQFVANAAVAGDQFVWHVDADPADVPQDSPWVQQYGLYANRVRTAL